MEVSNKPVAVAQMAKLFGRPADASSDDQLTVQAFLARAGLNSVLIQKLLDGSIENPQLYLVRLAALQLYLEKTDALDEKTVRAIRDLERQIEAAFWPAHATSTDGEFFIPFRLRKGVYANDQRASVDLAVSFISRMAREMGVTDLGSTRVLDIGCGVRFTQAFCGRGIPVKRYHGVDVDPDMIEFLSSAVKDERISYKHIDIYNARYHNAGQQLAVETDIGAEGEQFDLISLVSVFTHLDPPDFLTMLKLARKYVAPAGTLVFTTLIDETIPGDYQDSNPKNPLFMAYYREAAVRKYAQEAGWLVERLFPWSKQHWVVCKPA